MIVVDFLNKVCSFVLLVVNNPLSVFVVGSAAPIPAKSEFVIYVLKYLDTPPQPELNANETSAPVPT